MNKQELDLLNIIKKEAYVNQRQLSEASGYSLGKVNTSLAELVKAGYLNADYAGLPIMLQPQGSRRDKAF